MPQGDLAVGAQRLLWRASRPATPLNGEIRRANVLCGDALRSAITAELFPAATAEGGARHQPTRQQLDEICYKTPTDAAPGALGANWVRGPTTPLMMTAAGAGGDGRVLCVWRGLQHVCACWLAAVRVRTRHHRHAVRRTMHQPKTRARTRAARTGPKTLAVHWGRRHRAYRAASWAGWARLRAMLLSYRRSGAPPCASTPCK